MTYDEQLFLQICREYGVPVSEKYGSPMLEVNGVLKPLTEDSLHKLLTPNRSLFASTVFEEQSPYWVELQFTDLWAS